MSGSRDGEFEGRCRELKVVKSCSRGSRGHFLFTCLDSDTFAVR